MAAQQTVSDLTQNHQVNTGHFAGQSVSEFPQNLAESRATISQRERIKAFLKAISHCPSISKAAVAVEMDRKTHYDWLRDVPGYPAAFEKAWKVGWDSFEGTCVERAQF